jgi:PAS domain S-box-containing protein
MTSLPASPPDWQTRLAVLNDAPIGVVVCDRQARILGVNQMLCHITGYARAQLLSMTMAGLDVAETERDAEEHVARIIAAAHTISFQACWRRADDVVIDVDVAAHISPPGDVLFGYIRDISELTSVSHRLERSHAFYHFLSRANALIARVEHLPDLYQQICACATEIDTRLVLAWIGLVAPDGNRVEIAASAGSAQTYLDGIHVVTDDQQQEGRGPTGKAIREQRPVIINDYSASLATQPWQTRAASFGIASAIAIPLLKDQRCDGALMLYSAETNTFDDELVALLVGLGENIAHAMAFVRQRDEKVIVDHELERVRKNLRVILDATDETIVMVDATNVVIAINRIGAERFDSTPQAMTGQNIFALMPSEMAASRRAIFKQVLESGQPQTFNDCRAGRHYHSRVYPISGETPRLVVYAIDVTEAREAERRLAESEQRYRSLFEHSYSAMLIIDPADGAIIDANAAAASFYGWTRAQLTQMNINAINTLSAAQVQVEMATARTEQRNHFFFQHRLASGAIRDVDVFSGPIEIAQRTLLYSIVIDVTVQRHNLRRIQALLDIAALDTSALDEGAILKQGLEYAEAVTGSGIGFLHFVNEDQETIQLVTWTDGALRGCTAGYDAHYPISKAGIWADCFRERRPVVFNDYPGYTAKRGLPSGHAPLLRLISVPVIEDGKVCMMIGVGNKAEDYVEADINTVQLIGNDLWRIIRRMRAERQVVDNLIAQRELNAKLEDTRNQLLQSEKMASIGQLAAGVAHELNNPIGFVHSNLGTLDNYLKDIFAIVDAYAHVEATISAPCPSLASVRALKQEKDFDFLREDITQLMAESKDGLNRVKKIVQDLKDFSRVGETHWQLADIHAGIDSTLNIVWNELKYKCTITKYYAEHLPAIYCLPSQLNQVFMNLLINSAHAIESQGEMTITTRQADDAHIPSEFKDNGSGIAPEHLTRIFDPFFTTKPVGKGTGLGLPIVWGIIGKHHGDIAVHSTLGLGTTFTITLPIEAAVDTPAVP